jgi:HlyD family secretion protein
MNVPSSSPKSSFRRWLPWLLGATLLVALGFGLRPGPAVVETARAATGPLRATVSEEGKTRIRQRYVVSAPVAGQLQRIPLKPGAEIASGAVVTVITPMTASPLDTRTRALAETRRAAALAALEKARAAHDLARNELGRIQRMFEEKTLSPQDLDTAQMRENAAAREHIVAEAAWKAAEAELSDSAPADAGPAVEVRAPVGGRVLRVFQESERTVVQGTPLLEVGDPTDLEVVVEMLSRDGAALAPGARVLLEQWGGPAPLEGRVRLVEPAAFTKISALGVEEQRVNVVVDIVTPVAERASLGDNFRVEARVVVWEDPNALKVPVSALFRQNGGWGAYVLRDGRAEWVKVEVSRNSGAETQVVSGLREGDEVILYPGDRIKPGQRVAPRKV